MANSFTLGGALGSALTSAKGMVKNISSPQNQTLNNIKTGVVSAVKNAPANIGSAVNTANNVYKSVTNPVGTTAGLINKAVAPKPAVNTVQNTQGGITSSWQTPTNTPTNTPVKTAGVLPQKSAKPVDNFNYNADAGQTTGVVKSTTNVGADGSKQTTTYHPPTETKSTGTDKQGNNLPTTGGVATPQGEPNYKPETPNVYGQMTTDLANRYTKPIENYDQIQAKLADNAAKQAALEREIVAREANIGTSGVDLSLATGERGILSSKAQAGLSSLRNEGSQLASMLGAANTQQGLQQSALQQSATLAAPKSVSPSDTLVSPTNMQPQYGLGGGSGASPYMAWNAVQQNASTANQFAGQATMISAGMDYLEQAQARANDFLTKSGFNENNAAWANKTINEVFTPNSNPAGKATLVALNADIQKFLSQIVAANTGLTPTAVSGQLDGLDVSAMTPGQLNDFLANAKSLAMGQLSVAQQHQGAAQSSGTSLYGGTPADATQSAMVGGRNDFASGASGVLVGAGALGLGAEALGKIGPGIGSVLRVFGVGK